MNKKNEHPSNQLLGYQMKLFLIKAARLPFFYLIIGITLIVLADVDHLFILTKWKNIFDYTDKAGNIFIALAIVTFIYNILIAVCQKFQRKFAEKQHVASLILTSLRKGLRIIYFLVMLNIAIVIIGPSQFYLVLAKSTINTVIIASIGWIILQVLYTSEAVLYQHMMTLTRQEHMRVKALYTKIHIIRNIAVVVIIFLTIAAILMSFSSVRNIGISLLASAGFLTAIIGLAAQKSLFSLFSGLQIALSRPIKIGDIVVIESNTGVIEEITFTCVTLKLGERRRLLVPISYFIDKPYENWSHETDGLYNSFYLYVDYTLPIQPLRDALNKILLDSPYWDKKPEKLLVSNITERSVEVRIIVSASNPEELGELVAEVREKMLAFIRESFPEHLPKTRFIQSEHSKTATDQ